MKDVLELLRGLPKELLHAAILQLMKEEIISFTDIAKLHVEYINNLKKGNVEELMHLRSKFVDLWCGNKKDVPSKLLSLMQEAKDNKWANISQEDIDNSKWNRK